MWRLGSLAAAMFLAVAGCSSVYMKGTPLYEGEYTKPQGPPEDRVNLWPVAYYHKPALSVMWPLAEWTDDHAALRPIFTVYKLDKPKHEWNLFWPMVQFDFDSQDHRIVPVFWGTDDAKHPYFIAFPLVWWTHDTREVFPVVWTDDGGTVLPLVWWWKDGGTVFPFAWYQKGKHCHVLPFWLHYQMGPGEHDTHVLWPIFESLDTKEKHGWRLWPFAGDYKRKDWRYSYALWPLGQYIRDGDKTTRLAIPLYFESSEKDKSWRLLVPAFFHKADGADSLTVTPFWFGGRKGKTEWDGVVPLYYRWRDAAADTESLLTPLVATWRSPDKTSWAVVPLASKLAWGKGEKDLWFLGPFAHARWGGEGVQHHVVPLYYYDRAREGWFFLSPLVSWREEKGNKEIMLVPLLSRYSREKDGRQGLDSIPLLSEWQWKGRDNDLRLLWFLAHFRWGRSGELGYREVPPAFIGFRWEKDNVQNHVIPFYYYDRNEQMFLSPLASWRNKPGERFVNILVVGAHYTMNEKGEKELWGLPPFFHAKWGGGELAHHVLPLYAYDRKEKQFLTPLVSWQTKPDEGFLNLGMLLAHYAREKSGKRELTLPALLSTAWWNGKLGEKGMGIFPLLFWKKQAKPGDAASKESLWAFPWLHFGRETGTRSWFREGKKTEYKFADRSSGFFPFWHHSYDHRTPADGPPTTTADFSLLGWLYDCERREGQKDDKDPKKTHDYVRSRVLWHVMHYDQLDGDESLDLFPFITWDRKKDGYRKASFLWRFYRNERRADGSRSLDLFFLPLVRKKGG